MKTTDPLRSEVKAKRKKRGKKVEPLGAKVKAPVVSATKSVAEMTNRGARSSEECASRGMMVRSSPAKSMFSNLKRGK